MNLGTKTTYTIFFIVFGVLITLVVLGSLGYFNKKSKGAPATPPPPGTDPAMVPGKAMITDATTDGGNLTITFRRQGCPTCAVEISGIAVLTDGTAISLDTNVAPGLTSTTSYVSEKKIVSVDLEICQINEGLRLRGDTAPFAKRF